jgi:hypothetical protein
VNEKDTCEWFRSFDGHFNISCANETNHRANGEFHSDRAIRETKWDFSFCPYCGRKIQIHNARKRKAPK